MPSTLTPRPALMPKTAPAPARRVGAASLLPGLVAPPPVAPRPPAPPPAAAPAGKSPFELLLLDFHRSQARPGQTQVTIPMAEAARHFNLLATPDDMRAFATWFNAMDRPGMLGPRDHKLSATASVGKTTPSDPQAVRALQGALARRGYAVAATGVYDGPTERAVVAFKKAHGFVEAYRTPDGHPAVNPFADERVTAAILRV